MKTVRFLVSHVHTHALTADVFATVIGISGVESTCIGSDGRTIVIEYDDRFVNPDMLHRSIEGTGYGVEREDAGPSL